MTAIGIALAALSLGALFYCDVTIPRHRHAEHPVMMAWSFLLIVGAALAIAGVVIWAWEHLP